MKTLFLLLVIIIHPTISAGLASAIVMPRQEVAEIDQYAVYSAVIRDLYIDDEIELIVIENQTSLRRGAVRDAREKLAEFKLDDDLIESLLNENKATSSLEYSFTLPVRYVLIGREEINKLILEGGDPYWKRFKEKYPKSAGIIGLSRIGFTPSKEEALVHITNACGGLCGESHYILLRKEEKGWTIREKMLMSVS
jgi:hypothetical protein